MKSKEEDAITLEVQMLFSGELSNLKCSSKSKADMNMVPKHPIQADIHAFSIEDILSMSRDLCKNTSEQVEEFM